jgi:cytochrome P450
MYEPPEGASSWYRLWEFFLGQAMFMVAQPKVPGTKEPDVLGGLKGLMNDKRHKDEGLVVFSTFHPYFAFSKQNVFLWDIKLVKELLSKERFGDFYKGAAYDSSHPLIGDGLLSTPDSETWRNQRKIAQTGFKTNILETAVVQTRVVCKELFSRWDVIADGGEPFELYDEMLKVTIDALGKVAFSFDFNSVTAADVKDAPLYDTFKTILSILAYRTKIAAVGIQSNDPEFDKEMGYLNKVVDDLISTRRADFATKVRGKTPLHPADEPVVIPIDVYTCFKYTRTL